MPQLIVDDRDSRVSYTGTWTKTGTPRDYASTSTYSNSTASFTFNFHGTGASIIGSLQSGSSTTVNCSVTVSNSTGNIALQSFQSQDTSASTSSPQYQIPLCNTTGLADEDHTLTLNLQSNGPSNIFIDYVLVTSSNAASGTLFYDDTDPALSYAQNDTISFPAGASPSDAFNQTLHFLPIGSSVTLSFQGSSVNAFGLLDPFSNDSDSGPFAQFSIDGQPPVNSSDVKYDSQILANVPFFCRSNLSDGSHSLKITPLVDGVYLDYLTVPVNMTMEKTMSTNNVNPPKSGLSSMSAALVLMGVLLSVAVLLGCFYAFWRYRRRKNESKAIEETFFDPVTKKTTTAIVFENVVYKKKETTSTAAWLSRISRASLQSPHPV